MAVFASLLNFVAGLGILLRRHERLGNHVLKHGNCREKKNNAGEELRGEFQSEPGEPARNPEGENSDIEGVPDDVPGQ